MENNYKIRLCNFYIKGKCNKQNECSYAHGEKELICIFDEDCISEKCDRIHINQNKNINDNIYIEEKENKENLKKVDIFDEKDFPTFNNNINSKKGITEINNITCDLKNILNIKDENKNKESKYINKQIKELDIELLKLNKKDWCDSIEIEELEKEKILENKIYNSINENIKNEIEDLKLPVVTLTIKENCISKNYNNEVTDIIDEMYNKIQKLNIKIKQNIKKNVKNDYFKFILINDLNKIELNIKLFKYNYEDCLKE